MALQPGQLTGKDRMQPGARGEIFQADLPGYRNQGDRINRTNMKLNVGQHDVPNVKYQFDYRLPVLFRYGWAYGFNQIVLPKGRIVAIDPTMNLIDTDMKVAHNVMTLANGGAPVKIREAADKYKNSAGSAAALVSPDKQNQAAFGAGTQWSPLVGLAAAYTDKSYRPFAGAATEGVNAFVGPNAQLATAGFSVDSATGKIKATATGAVADNVRAGNIPIGILQRNEYTRDDDAFNGMMPGPVLTDALVELPWFAYKDKAEQNPWGSAYGGIFPGAVVKSDENGRLTVSPLSFEADVASMTVAEYEFERKQVVGQIYEVNNALLPEGAAKWATWALEDRMNFEEFNPTVYPENNRRGEDAVSNSPFKSNGEYPGYPYDPAYKNSDLHMLGGLGRQDVYDARLNAEYQLDNLGIPGLTDGYNAVSRAYTDQPAGKIHYAGGVDYIDMYFRTTEVSLEAGTLQIKVGSAAYVPCTVGATLDVGGQNDWLQVKYADEKQGIVVLSVIDKAKADLVLDAAAGKSLDVKFKFNKRGLAGVPTFLDWDGCVGSVKVLLQK